MKSIPVEYIVGEIWRETFQDGLRQIGRLQARVAGAKAAIYDAEQEIFHLRHTMGVTIGLIQKTEELPPVSGSYRLNEDGTKLLGDRMVLEEADNYKAVEPDVVATVEHTPDVVEQGDEHGE